jgi:uncharacterized protein (DUF1800 family)
MRSSNSSSILTVLSIAIVTLLLSACGVKITTSSDVVKPTETQASRMLAQATFGPTADEIKRMETIGTSAWFNDQFAKPQTLHLAYLNQNFVLPLPANTTGESLFLESFWQQAIKGDDQLRQRVAYALSQILVISFQNDTLASMPRGVASYYDTLGAHAFGNYRDLLEAVSLHPMMGIYLSSLRNQKTAGARVPDENYAREVMQLFTIGLRELNPNGTDTTTPPTPTYTNGDIKFLAKVFTGWSWAGPDKSAGRFSGNIADPDRDWKPMQNYGSTYHEVIKIADPDNPTSLFTGATSSALANTSGEASLKIALDKLFNHPNIGPFIGRQLIQRLVTSNPSPAYIGRVAAAFEATGSHPRGDMKALIKAVLLDPEAIAPTAQPTYDSTTTGKLREPVLRLASWMRAFNVSSASGKFKIPNLNSTQNSLGQTPMSSPTVFNFYRPEYQPPNSAIATSGKFAPEMQITEETSVVGYLNFMRSVIPNGVGTSSDVKANYATELQLVVSPELLVDRVKLLLTQNQMSDALRNTIISAIKSNANNSAANKVNLAIFLTMASPDYLVQK